MHRRPLAAALLVGAVLLSPGAAAAHETVDLPTLLRGFGMSLDDAELRHETVGDGLHVIFGVGGNIAASIGSDGVLIVDDQFPELVPAILERLRLLGGGAPDYVVNTHWHFDHAQGNLELGRGDARIVAHASSRRMMQGDHVINLVGAAYLQEAYPAEALPDLTFDSRMQIHWNGQTIELIHAGPAHTNGDAAVYFRADNAIHMGDVYNNTGYPFIDVDNGGSIGGVIAFCEAVLAEIDSETTVIPGHGPVATHADLVDYVAMLRTIRDRIERLIARGATLAEVVAAKPTREWDAQRGANAAQLIDRAYHDLLRSR